MPRHLLRFERLVASTERRQERPAGIEAACARMSGPESQCENGGERKCELLREAPVSAFEGNANAEAKFPTADVVTSFGFVCVVMVHQMSHGVDCQKHASDR
jgi:hypothetical protein